MAQKLTSNGTNFTRDASGVATRRKAEFTSTRERGIGGLDDLYIHLKDKVDGTDGPCIVILIAMRRGFGHAHPAYRRHAAPSCNGGRTDRPRGLLRTRRRKPGVACPTKRFIQTLLPAVRPLAAARAGLFVLSSLLSAGTVLAQTPVGTSTESAQIADAFAVLDSVAAAIANRLTDLAGLSGLPLPPPPPNSI